MAEVADEYIGLAKVRPAVEARVVVPVPATLDEGLHEGRVVEEHLAVTPPGGCSLRGRVCRLSRPAMPPLPGHARGERAELHGTAEDVMGGLEVPRIPGRKARPQATQITHKTAIKWQCQLNCSTVQLTSNIGPRNSKIGNSKMGIALSAILGLEILSCGRNYLFNEQPSNWRTV